MDTTLQRLFPSCIAVLVLSLCSTSVNAQSQSCDGCVGDLSIGFVIAIVAGGLILLTAVPILCCFCCACCCFSGRSKSKTNVVVNTPGQSQTTQVNQQTTFQIPQQNQQNYPQENHGHFSHPPPQPHQYPSYPTSRDNIHDSTSHHQSPSYPQGPSYPPGSSYPSNSPQYPYPSHRSRLTPNPSKLPPYSPMNHSRIATPLVGQLTPYRAQDQQGYGAPLNSTGLQRSHSSAGYGSQQPLYPSNLTPSALGLQRSPSYLGAGQPQPFYPPLHQQTSGIKRSASAVTPDGHIPQSYDNRAYNPDMNRGYGFQNQNQY